MPYLQLQDQQIPLPQGEVTVGAFEGADVRLPTGDGDARAVVTVGPKGVVIRRGTVGSVVMVNGVQLGAEPSPLLHGDRIELAGHELRLGDDRQQGSTTFVNAADVAAIVAAQKVGSSPRKPTSATGGRLVSLVDGREYTVAAGGLTFGREVGNDVVLSSSEVSRKHASIAPGADGYVLTDHSTNGVWVNGARVQGTQLLGRGDVLRMGTEEFRFYADVAKAPATVAPAAAPPVATASADPASTPEPAIAPVAAAAAGIAAASVPEPASAPIPEPITEPSSAGRSTRAPLATLEIRNEGPLKGTKFDIHAALTNIGRGDHNDIAIRDESVSDSHAKIQKRADGWWIVDQESTNGTYVGGRRVQGEQRLEGAPDVRFGGIKMTFRPTAQAAVEGGSTRAIAAVDVESLRRKPSAKTPAMAKPATPAPEAPKSGCGSVIAFFVTLVGAGAGFLALLLTTPG